MPDPLEPFPEIVAMGRERLQELCDEWCRSPVAREFGVIRIDIRTHELSFVPVFELSAANYDKDDLVHFPFDRLLNHIIDGGCRDSEKDDVKERLVALRRKAGVAVFQRYKVNVRSQNLATRCPLCSQVLGTDIRIFDHKPFTELDLGPLTCPNCGHVFNPRGDDFFRVSSPLFDG